MRALFVNCGDPDPPIASVYGPYLRWFREALGPSVDLDPWDPRKESLDPGRLDASDSVIVSGSSHSSYEPLPWIRALEDFLRDAISVRRLPVLGVCFGHQVLAQAFGGSVARNPRGREIGTAQITTTLHARRDPLFAALPDEFAIQVTHRDTVTSLPDGASILAKSALDDCQAFAFETAWGVQFHPELTPEIVSAYLRARRDVIASEGLDPEALLAGVRPSDAGERLLARFVEVASQQPAIASDGSAPPAA